MKRRWQRRRIDKAWEDMEANLVEQCRQIVHAKLLEQRIKMPDLIPTSITRVHVDLDIEGIIE